MINAGHEVSLIPTYTPLRLDEHNESVGRIFFGGLNVYLNDKFSWWQRIPRPLTRWLDRPGLIRLATRWSVSNKAEELGELTLSMLQGENGPHRRAVEELDSYLYDQLQPGRCDIQQRPARRGAANTQTTFLLVRYFVSYRVMTFSWTV